VVWDQTDDYGMPVWTGAYEAYAMSPGWYGPECVSDPVIFFIEY
jgi:hypothetical protein